MWQQRLLAFRKEYDHPAWGVAHSERVYALTRQLAGADGAKAAGRPAIDWDAVFAAAHLHDLGTFEPYRQPGVDHAERSAQVAPGILAEAGFPPERVELVQGIIRGHMFDAEPGPSPEAILFHDADTLDFLGAIGVARVLAIVGLDDWAPDLKSAVELIRRFSRELPPRLQTPAARDLGRLRQVEMEDYLAASSETGNLGTL